jgi:FkbM family methyltransferase
MKKQPYWGWVNCKAGPSNFYMFLGGRDDGVALKFLWNGSYEKRTMELWSTMSKFSDVVLDIGAHTGSYTLAAKQSNSSATVISFEPNYVNYSRLNLNLRLNGFNTEGAYMLAAGESNKQTLFTVSGNSDYHSSGGHIGNKNGNNNYLVSVVTVDSFIKTHLWSKNMLVKIDTEGFEAECLRGMSALIKHSHPIIFFECILKNPGKEVEEILKEQDYVFYIVDDKSGLIELTDTIRPENDTKGKLIMSKLNRIAVYKDAHSSFINKMKQVT